MLVVSNRQRSNPQIGKVTIISHMAKHVIGLLLMFFAVLIFLSQFIGKK